MTFKLWAEVSEIPFGESNPKVTALKKLVLLTILGTKIAQISHPSHHLFESITFSRNPKGGNMFLFPGGFFFTVYVLLLDVLRGVDFIMSLEDLWGLLATQLT